MEWVKQWTFDKETWVLQDEADSIIEELYEKVEDIETHLGYAEDEISNEECRSFDEAMKWFEGFNPPRKIINGETEDFADSLARISEQKEGVGDE